MCTQTMHIRGAERRPLGEMKGLALGGTPCNPDPNPLIPFKLTPPPQTLTLPDLCPSEELGPQNLCVYRVCIDV